jgi:hypothetical protein
MIHDSEGDSENLPASERARLFIASSPEYRFRTSGAKAEFIARYEAYALGRERENESARRWNRPSQLAEVKSPARYYAIAYS